MTLWPGLASRSRLKLRCAPAIASVRTARPRLSGWPSPRSFANPPRPRSRSPQRRNSAAVPACVPAKQNHGRQPPRGHRVDRPRSLSSLSAPTPQLLHLAARLQHAVAVLDPPAQQGPLQHPLRVLPRRHSQPRRQKPLQQFRPVGHRLILTSDSRMLPAVGGGLRSHCSATAERNLESRSPKGLVCTGFARVGTPRLCSDCFGLQPLWFQSNFDKKRPFRDKAT